MTDDVIRFTYGARPWSLNAERSGGSRGHGHWSKTRAVTAEWRTAFRVLGLRGGVSFTSAHVIVEITMKPPLADTGNAYGAVKAAIDGLVDARVLPDDTPDSVVGVTMIRPYPTRKGERDRLSLTLIRQGDQRDTCPLCLARLHRPSDR